MSEIIAVRESVAMSAAERRVYSRAEEGITETVEIRRTGGGVHDEVTEVCTGFGREPEDALVFLGNEFEADEYLRMRDRELTSEGYTQTI
jgi:hypothetical protein